VREQAAHLGPDALNQDFVGDFFVSYCVAGFREHAARAVAHIANAFIKYITEKAAAMNHLITDKRTTPMAAIWISKIH
jgi:hypothetical protein